eukprot:IDg22444t1
MDVSRASSRSHVGMDKFPVFEALCSCNKRIRASAIHLYISVAEEVVDRKPENGCEIKTSACGRRGIMLQPEIVKSSEEAKHREQFENMSHGTAVTRRLENPYIQLNLIVCADSHFKSVKPIVIS